LKRLTLITTGLAFRKSVAADSKPSSHAGSEENLRVAVEKNKVLQLVKSLVNRSVNALKIGDTLKGYYVKT